MALSQAANIVERIVGHGGDATTEQNLSNPNRDPKKYADPSGARMKALVWAGKNTVKLSKLTRLNRKDSADNYQLKHTNQPSLNHEMLLSR